MCNFLFFKSDRACLFPSPKTPNPTARTRETFFAPKLLLRNGREPSKGSPVAPFPFLFSFHSCNVRFLLSHACKRTVRAP